MIPSSDAALAHLRSIKPNDGWAVQQKDGTSSRWVRLTRRNVPITDTYFLDIYHDKRHTKNQVVGILNNANAKPAGSGGGVVQAQVLVDATGRPTGPSIALISVSGYSPDAPHRTVHSASSSTPTTEAMPPTLSDAQNRDILFYGGGLIVVAVVSRLFFSVLFVFSFSILLFPVAYLYLVSTCPTPESFDAKKELKRTLRGYHLPENHPEKPKGLLSETLARIQASVTTELATLPGYEVTTIPLAGAAIVACARVPSVQMDYYWIGANNQWYYVYGAEIQQTHSQPRR